MPAPQFPAETVTIRLADDILSENGVRTLRGQQRQRLLLDLHGVRLPTAGGLGALIKLHKELASRDGHLVLFNVRPWTYEVFTLMHLSEVLDVRAARNGRRVSGLPTSPACNACLPSTKDHYAKLADLESPARIALQQGALRIRW